MESGGGALLRFGQASRGRSFLANVWTRNSVRQICQFSVCEDGMRFVLGHNTFRGAHVSCPAVVSPFKVRQGTVSFTVNDSMFLRLTVCR